MKAAVKAGLDPYTAGLKDGKWVGFVEGERAGILRERNRIVMAAFKLTYEEAP